MKNSLTASLAALAFGAFLTGSAQAQNNCERIRLSSFESDFVQKSAQGHMLEIWLGHLANQNASSSRLRSFGRIMVLDHTKALERAKSIADLRQMALWDTLDMKHLDMYNRLAGLTGTAFDSAYLTMMKEDHEEDYKAFQEAQRRSVNMDVLSYVNVVTPLVKEHMDMINDIGASMGS